MALKDYYFLLISLFVFLSDQLTKQFFKEKVLIKSFLEFRKVTNTGALFGTFKGNNFFLMLLGFFIFLFILFYFRKFGFYEKLFFSLVIGGVLGNLFDRLIYGYVIDFIAFSFWPPVFNFADASITVGVIGIACTEFLKK